MHASQSEVGLWYTTGGMGAVGSGYLCTLDGDQSLNGARHGLWRPTRLRRG